MAKKKPAKQGDKPPKLTARSSGQQWHAHFLWCKSHLAKDPERHALKIIGAAQTAINVFMEILKTDASIQSKALELMCGYCDVLIAVYQKKGGLQGMEKISELKQQKVVFEQDLKALVASPTPTPTPRAHATVAQTQAEPLGSLLMKPVKLLSINEYRRHLGEYDRLSEECWQIFPRAFNQEPKDEEASKALRELDALTEKLSTCLQPVSNSMQAHQKMNLLAGDILHLFVLYQLRYLTFHAAQSGSGESSESSSVRINALLASVGKTPDAQQALIDALFMLLGDAQKLLDHSHIRAAAMIVDAVVKSSLHGHEFLFKNEQHDNVRWLCLAEAELVQIRLIQARSESGDLLRTVAHVALPHVQKALELLQHCKNVNGFNFSHGTRYEVARTFLATFSMEGYVEQSNCLDSAVTLADNLEAYEVMLCAYWDSLETAETRPAANSYLHEPLVSLMEIIDQRAKKDFVEFKRGRAEALKLFCQIIHYKVLLAAQLEVAGLACDRQDPLLMSFIHEVLDQVHTPEQELIFLEEMLSLLESARAFFNKNYFHAVKIIADVILNEERLIGRQFSPRYNNMKQVFLGKIQLLFMQSAARIDSAFLRPVRSKEIADIGLSFLASWKDVEEKSSAEVDSYYETKIALLLASSLDEVDVQKLRELFRLLGLISNITLQEGLRLEACKAIANTLPQSREITGNSEAMSLIRAQHFPLTISSSKEAFSAHLQWCYLVSIQPVVDEYVHKIIKEVSCAISYLDGSSLANDWRYQQLYFYYDLLEKIYKEREEFDQALECGQLKGVAEEALRIEKAKLTEEKRSEGLSLDECARRFKQYDDSLEIYWTALRENNTGVAKKTADSMRESIKPIAPSLTFLIHGDNDDQARGAKSLELDYVRCAMLTKMQHSVCPLPDYALLVNPLKSWLLQQKEIPTSIESIFLSIISKVVGDINQLVLHDRDLDGAKILAEDLFEGLSSYAASTDESKRIIAGHLDEVEKAVNVINQRQAGVEENRLEETTENKASFAFDQFIDELLGVDVIDVERHIQPVLTLLERLQAEQALEKESNADYFVSCFQGECWTGLFRSFLNALKDASLSDEIKQILLRFAEFMPNKKQKKSLSAACGNQKPKKTVEEQSVASPSRKSSGHNASAPDSPSRSPSRSPSKASAVKQKQGSKSPQRVSLSAQDVQEIRGSVRSLASAWGLSRSKGTADIYELRDDASLDGSSLKDHAVNYVAMLYGALKNIPDVGMHGKAIMLPATAQLIEVFSRLNRDGLLVAFKQKIKQPKQPEGMKQVGSKKKPKKAASKPMKKEEKRCSQTLSSLPGSPTRSLPEEKSASTSSVAVVTSSTGIMCQQLGSKSSPPSSSAAGRYISESPALGLAGESYISPRQWLKEPRRHALSEVGCRVDQLASRLEKVLSGPSFPLFWPDCSDDSTRKEFYGDSVAPKIL